MKDIAYHQSQIFPVTVDSGFHEKKSTTENSTCQRRFKMSKKILHVEQDSEWQGRLSLCMSRKIMNSKKEYSVFQEDSERMTRFRCAIPRKSQILKCELTLADPNSSGVS